MASTGAPCGAAGGRCRPQGHLLRAPGFSRDYGFGYRTDLAIQVRHRFYGKRIGIVITEGLPAIDFLTVDCKDLFPGSRGAISDIA